MNEGAHQGYRRVQRENTVEYQVELPTTREMVGRVLALCDEELGGALARQPGAVRISTRFDGQVLAFAFTPPPPPRRVDWVDRHPATGTLSWPPATVAYRAVVSVPCCGRPECVREAQRYVRNLVAGEGGFRSSGPVSGEPPLYL